MPEEKLIYPCDVWIRCRNNSPAYVRLTGETSRSYLGYRLSRRGYDSIHNGRFKKKDHVVLTAHELYIAEWRSEHGYRIMQSATHELTDDQIIQIAKWIDYTKMPEGEKNAKTESSN